ncbi:S-layer homology domain-containing protein [Acetomicrobium flavidum]|uniref:S-layer homology domain-containing protein n=1 Tax=Acetomicrobium flavidum TaxID=49896 RepID=A0ABY1JBP1_9BACT|nr:S-layer homology domain-containing protein [Acetomicrobium flavidum]
MKKLLALVAVFALVAFAAPAFAANPFVDVPMNHWAYDAISQLAAKGIIQGYPDGTYRGNHPMTRYEMSMLVARALATVDMEKASKEDVEMLKKLVVEFKDELEALGVRVDALDERVAVLEENLGGWKFWGELRFDARWADEGDGAYANSDSQSGYKHNGETEFDLNRYRLWMSKQIDDKTTVTMRIGGSDVSWQRYYATIQLPWDSYLMVGQWNYDWEDEAGLYIDEDAWFTDQTLKGFYWRKNLEKGDITIFAAHNEDDEKVDDYTELGDMYNYGARFNFQPSDKFRIAISGLYYDYDNDGTAVMTYSSAQNPRWLYDPVADNVFPSKSVTETKTQKVASGSPLAVLNTASGYIVGSDGNMVPIDNSSNKLLADLKAKLSDGTEVVVPVDTEINVPSIPGTSITVSSDTEVNYTTTTPAFESKYQDYGVYWADFGITFAPGFQFKGAYYMEDLDLPAGAKNSDDSPNAYKAIIDVSQDTLKFTSLWVEYAKFDPNFHTALSPWDAFGAELTPNLTMPAVSNVWETEALFVKLEQKWSDKWATYQRYGQFDHSLEGYAKKGRLANAGSFDITNWTFGVQYWYTPTVLFELAYDDVDYDEGWTEVDADLKDDSLVRLRTWIFF